MGRFFLSDEDDTGLEDGNWLVVGDYGQEPPRYWFEA